MDDTVEIIQAIDGKLIAKAGFGDRYFTIELPTGFESWKDDEQRAHLKRHIVPRLKFLVTKARLNIQRNIDHDPALAAQDFEQDGITPTKSKARDSLRAARKRLKLAN